MDWLSHRTRTGSGRLALGVLSAVAASLATHASAAGLTGRVVDVFGAPLEGVPLAVRTAPMAPTGERLLTTDTAHEITSNSDGRYTVAGLADATYELAIAHTRLRAGTRYDIVGVRIRGVPVVLDGGPLALGLDGVVTDVDVTVVAVTVVAPGERVDIRVTRADGSEASSAKVSYKVVDANGSSSRGLTTNERGRCGFTRRDPADGTLTVTHDGQSASMRLRFVDNAPSRGPLVVTLAATPHWPIDGSEWRLNPENGHEYRVITARSWDDAMGSAAALGGHLATITSDAERRWVAGVIHSGVQAYIGLSDADEEGSWRWVTGEPLVYTRWRAGEPNNGAFLEHYAVMHGGSGEWNDEQDEMTLSGGAAVVEREARPDSVAETSESVALDARELMPLAVGSVWTYEDQVSGDTGTVTVTEASEDADGRVSYTVDIGVFRMAARMSYGDGGGLSVMYPDELPDLVVPWLPNGRDLAWDVRVDDGDGGSDAVMRFEVVDTAGVVDTPSGTYEDCTAVRLVIAGDESGYFHYAPGVGLVRMSSADGHGEGDQLQTDWLLVSYTPAE